MENMEATIVNTGSRHEYYKHSGAISPVGIITVLALGLIGTIVLSVIYSYATYYIPFIYLNFFLTIGFGIGVGFFVGLGGKIGKVRNTTIMTVLGIAIGVFALYSAWVIWLFAHSKQQLWFFNPADILLVIQFLASTGVWEIRGATPTGVILYIIWFIEAAIIIGAATIMAMSFLKGDAFCERCNAWVDDEVTLPPLNYSNDPNVLRGLLEQGNFSALSQLKRADMPTNFFTAVKLAKCKECSDFYVMTVQSVSITKNSKGEEKKEENAIVENLIIDSRVYNSIKAWAEASKQPAVPQG